MKDLVILKGNEAVCDSLEVAERFHKRHQEILYAIEGRKCSCNGKGCKKCDGRGYQQLGLLQEDLEIGAKSHLSKMFRKSTYTDTGRRKRPIYYINRDGFSILTMGFTGSEALQWKLDYIKAFNSMEKLIQEQQSNEWKFFRHQGKSVRLAETDTLKKLVEYSKAMGSNNLKQIYSNYTRLANKTVGIKSIKEATTMQLGYLMLVENIFIQVIRSGMDLNKDYHDIYQDCKAKAIQLSNAVAIGITA
ncbi:MAG: phage regulatory protein rha family [Herbinix sp.]|nr:phage regulatory protein rha family [Herbinix sp.]